MRETRAIVNVDALRCFFPAQEGLRLGLEGFGELPVEGAEKIIGPMNRLIQAFVEAKLPIVEAREAHSPDDKVHFSDTPNWKNTWPVHGIAGTPGAEPHPELLTAQDLAIATVFIKGNVPARTPQEDLSYTGKYAHNPETGQLLPDFLKGKRVATTYVVGLAIGPGEIDGEHNLCVDSTAIDLKRDGFDVVLVTDATEAVAQENRNICFKNLGDFGIRLMTADEAIAEVKAAYAGVQ